MTTEQDLQDLGKAVTLLKLLGSIDEKAGAALGVADGTLDKFLVAELAVAADDDNHPLGQTLEWAIMGGAEKFQIDPEGFTIGVMIGFVRGLGYASRMNGTPSKE